MLTLLLAGLAHVSRRPPSLRAWHPVFNLRAVAHGSSVQTTLLSGETMHVRDKLMLTFGAKGRQHALNLTRVDTFSQDAGITYVRSGEHEDRLPPLLPTYHARDSAGDLIAAGTLRQDGRVRALVRDGPRGLLVIEPEFNFDVELPAGMARPRTGEPFAYDAEDVQLTFNDDRPHLQALGKGEASSENTPEVDRIRTRFYAKAGRNAPPVDPPEAEGARQHRALSTFDACFSELHRLVIGVAIDQLFVKQAGSADKALIEMAEAMATLNAVIKDQFNLEVVVSRVIIQENNAQNASYPPSYRAQDGTAAQCVSGGDLIDDDGLLNAMRDWSKLHAAPGTAEFRTLWHLLSGCNTDPVAGKAYVAIPCDCCTGSDEGTNIAYSRRLQGFTWLVVAHEVSTPLRPSRADLLFPCSRALHGALRHDFACRISARALLRRSGTTLMPHTTQMAESWRPRSVPICRTRHSPTSPRWRSAHTSTP